MTVRSQSIWPIEVIFAIEMPIHQEILHGCRMISTHRATFVKDDEAQFAETQKGTLKQRLWDSENSYGEPLYWLMIMVVMRIVDISFYGYYTIIRVNAS